MAVQLTLTPATLKTSRWLAASGSKLCGCSLSKCDAREGPDPGAIAFGSRVGPLAALGRGQRVNRQGAKKAGEGGGG
jgi:hypothetical protein